MHFESALQSIEWKALFILCQYFCMYAMCQKVIIASNNCYWNVNIPKMRAICSEQNVIQEFQITTTTNWFDEANSHRLYLNEEKRGGAGKRCGGRKIVANNYAASETKSYSWKTVTFIFAQLCKYDDDDDVWWRTLEILSHSF